MKKGLLLILLYMSGQPHKNGTGPIYFNDSISLVSYLKVNINRSNYMAASDSSSIVKDQQ